MLFIRDVVRLLEELAPTEFQESYDNSGLLTGSMQDVLRGVTIALDCTEEVVKDAVAHDCNLIIAHHPIIFSGLKKITGRNYIERTVIEAIQAHVCIYAIHTNLDHVRNGVNDKICEKLQLSGREFLLPKMTKSGIVIGSGMTGFLPKAMAPEAFLEYLAEKMQIDFCKYTPVSRLISKVAVCGGAGSFLLEEAKKSGADAFITSDFKYHQFFDAENQIMIADIGHYESERFTCELLADFLRSSFHGINLRITGVNTNPVQYFKKQ